MHPNRSSRCVHRGEFKSQVIAECRQPGASVSALAIAAHGLNSIVVRKWLAGHGPKRMGSAALAVARANSPALQFVPVELLQPERVVASPAATACIRIELERAGLQVKLQCPASAGPLYAAQLRALADALCAG